MIMPSFTVCPHCAHANSISSAMSRCIRCVNANKFEPKAVAHDKGDEWDTYCRNDVESTRKMVLATTNPYREEKITRDVLDHFVYAYKLDEEVKEKENMYTNNKELEVTFRGRPVIVESYEVSHDYSPYDMPSFKIEGRLSRSAVPYSEYSKKKKEEAKMPTIKNVVFNPPATIVFWADGTKTVVKASNEEFDPEKGLAMAITKKILGNKGNYFETVKKWTKGAPSVDRVAVVNEAYEQGKDDKWTEIEAKLEELKNNNNIVVGNRVTKKFYNEFLNILMPNKQNGEA